MQAAFPAEAFLARCPAALFLPFTDDGKPLEGGAVLLAPGYESDGRRLEGCPPAGTARASLCFAAAFAPDSKIRIGLGASAGAGPGPLRADAARNCRPHA